MIIINTKKLLSLLFAGTLCCLAAKPTTALASDATSVRLSGASRYETCMEISKYGWTSSDYVIIATGENYPDALCAAPLAKSKNAPIILTTKDSLNNSVVAELQRLNVKKAFLIGGTGVLSENIVTQLNALNINPTRLAGIDRYETSLKIAEYLGTDNGLAVATGDNFPDALSFAPIAAKKGLPILLSSRNALDSKVADFIKNKSIPVSYVIGGTGALSDNILSSLPNSKRLSGMDRYETNINVIKEFEKELDFNSVFLATGNNFPDALSGSALAPKFNAPIVLTDSSLSEISKIYTRTKAVNKVYLLGGTGVINSETEADFLLLPKDTNPLFRIKVYNKYGYIDKTGKTIIPANYFLAEPFSEGLAAVYQFTQSNIKPGSIANPLNYLMIKCGIIDKTGRQILAPTYDHIGSFNDGIALAYNFVNGTQKWSILNRQGKVVKELDQNVIELFSKDGMICIETGSAPNIKHGFLDKTGKEVVPPIYEFVENFSAGLAPVSLNDKYGYINKTGAVVVPIKYECTQNLSDGYGKIFLNYKVGIIDSYCREIVPISYENAFYAGEDMFGVKTDNGFWGFLNKDRSEVISPQYNLIGKFSNGAAPVLKENKWGLVDKTGKMVLDFTYDDIQTCSNGLFLVRSGDVDTGKYGFVNAAGKIIAPPIYESTHIIQDYINPQAYYVPPFENGLALVTLNGVDMYIDEAGNVVWQATNQQ